MDLDCAVLHGGAHSSGERRSSEMVELAGTTFSLLLDCVNKCIGDVRKEAFKLCWVCLFCLFWLCLFVAGFLFLSWNGIINTCTTNPGAFHSIGPLAVINTASKHLHNDLARAIKALEQKKGRRHSNW